MKGLILAGGTGSRLRPLTHTGPKQLIPIANKPNILYCVEDLRGAGIRDIGVILGNNMPEQVRELLGDGSRFGVKITYVVQGEPKGIAHAILCGRPFLGTDPFVVYLGDNVLKGGLKGLLEVFRKRRADAVIGLCKVSNPEAFGVAVRDGKGRVSKTVEKPRPPPSDLAVIGVYLFTPSVFPIIEKLKPSGRGELEITDAINGLIDGGRRVESHLVTGWWKDTGRPEDILEANHLVLDDLERSVEGLVEPGADVRGRVHVAQGAVVEKGAVVRGPCTIGEKARVRSGTFIGPYTAIGPNCDIAGAEIENTIVLEGSRIHTRNRITDSLIGARCVILDADSQVPQGHRLVIGENSQVRL